MESFQTTWTNLLHLADKLGEAGAVAPQLSGKLTIAQIRVVAVIFEHQPDGMMLKDIADELHLTPGAVSQTVDNLVREGIVERTVSPTDRRAVLIRPAPFGLELSALHDRKLNDAMRKISEAVDPVEYEIFARVVVRLRQRMDQFAAEAEMKK